MPWDDSLSAVHNDDVKDAGRALEAVRWVTVDWDAVERRNTNYIQENIANRRKREADDAKKAQAAAS